MMKRWLMACATLTATVHFAGADDWPQWRGPNRDAKISGFVAPQTWPKQLTKKWSITVGDGVSTPALVGDKLFVFARQGGDEVIRCVEADSGKVVWEQKYASGPATGPAGGFAGPRASPAVADGKVVTFGVRGMLTCCDAASGKVLWQKDDFKGSWPAFFTSSSPLLVDGTCIVQLGGKEGGKMRGGKDHAAVVAYDLASGKEKWRWAQEASDYASPVLATINGQKVIFAETDQSIVALNAADGKLLWKTPYAPPKRGYNAATPIVQGTTVFFTGSGRGVKAFAIQMQGGKLDAKSLWSNDDNSVQYNTPILKDGLIYGISIRDQLFCVDTKTQKTLWVAPLKGNRGYGSIVDAGSVLFALTPAGILTVFEPSPDGFKQIAAYTVAERDTYAYPVIDGNKVFIKDKNNLTLFTIE